MRNHIFGDKLKKKTEMHLNVETNNNQNNCLTPQKIYYNKDTTSPYYINITHRRKKGEPKIYFPPNDDLDEDVRVLHIFIKNILLRIIVFCSYHLSLKQSQLIYLL